MGGDVPLRGRLGDPDGGSDGELGSAGGHAASTAGSYALSWSSGPPGAGAVLLRTHRSESREPTARAVYANLHSP
jgi:hypothetical protein